jgi:hypothetical protein
MVTLMLAKMWTAVLVILVGPIPLNAETSLLLVPGTAAPAKLGIKKFQVNVSSFRCVTQRFGVAQTLKAVVSMWTEVLHILVIATMVTRVLVATTTTAMKSTLVSPAILVVLGERVRI